jgi:hypothetical protein
MQVNALLEKAGLESQEIALYLTLVQEKIASAGTLAKKSHIPRTYAYRHLKSLAQKGLVREIDKPRSIRQYEVTDFDAPKRWFLHQESEYLTLREGFDRVNLDLMRLASPHQSAPSVQQLRDHGGAQDFWKLLHSTISREIWILNPPSWWGNKDYSPLMKKWELFREKQHIWEKRIISSPVTASPPFTDIRLLKTPFFSVCSVFLIDQYQVQVFSFDPFYALRIESKDMISVLKAVLV